MDGHSQRPYPEANLHTPEVLNTDGHLLAWMTYNGGVSLEARSYL